MDFDINSAHKINGISKILWINLEDSFDRAKYMNELLENINIPNIRINAIDGRKNNNLVDIIKGIKRKDSLNNKEIACTLSHIKAISSLKNEKGDYFMICEDDIALNNIKHFPNHIDLKYIIDNAPKNFDILMIYKTSYDTINEIYADWNEYNNNGTTIYGAVCYIISNRGVNNFINNVSYYDDENKQFIINNNLEFHTSDVFLYKNLKTYVYKYNFITSIDQESTLDSNLTFYRQSVNFQLDVINNDFHKNILKVKFDNSLINYFFNNKYYSMQNQNQFLEYFLPDNYQYIIVNNNEKANIAFWNSDLEDNSFLNDNELNILISIENCPKWAHNNWPHYNHYNKYGNYNDSKIKIYFYGHIDRLYITDNFISIPMIYRYIDYYKKNCDIIRPSIYTNFKDKLFCLVINKSKLNPEIDYCIKLLSQYGKVDDLSIYDDFINSKSCYHSQELLNIMNKYKFTICFQNSYNDGYITEKLFNCFFARTIPIYKGSPIISDFINQDSFVTCENFNNIYSILNDENIYNIMINFDKISPSYIDHDYKNKFHEFIQKNIF
jgi:GR25 family glycosyltransferase involved in LPS biosynthesis